MIRPTILPTPIVTAPSATKSRAVAGSVAGQSEPTASNGTESSARNTDDELDLSASQPGNEVDGLTPEQEEQVKELSARDREVRAHEQAHVSAAGPYLTGGPTYTFQTGPDGRNYAIGGEVQIDTSPVEGDPEATIQKAQIVRRAALAPAEPSAQDRQVAANASKVEQAAAAELRSQQSDSIDEGGTNQQKPSAGTVIDLAKSQDEGRFLDLIA